MNQLWQYMWQNSCCSHAVRGKTSSISHQMEKNQATFRIYEFHVMAWNIRFLVWIFFFSCIHDLGMRVLYLLYSFLLFSPSYLKGFQSVSNCSFLINSIKSSNTPYKLSVDSKLFACLWEETSHISDSFWPHLAILG